MKYYWNLFSQLKIYVTTPMSCTSQFYSHMAMISNIVIVNAFFTNLARITQLELFCFFIHDQIFVKVFFHYLFTVFKLFKNCFHKFITSIFTSKNNYLLSKLIINTNKFLSKTTRSVILVFFGIKTFTVFNTI